MRGLFHESPHRLTLALARVNIEVRLRQLQGLANLHTVDLDCEVHRELVGGTPESLSSGDLKDRRRQVDNLVDAPGVLGGELVLFRPLGGGDDLVHVEPSENGRQRLLRLLHVRPIGTQQLQHVLVLVASRHGTACVENEPATLTILWHHRRPSAELVNLLGQHDPRREGLTDGQRLGVEVGTVCLCCLCLHVLMFVALMFVPGGLSIVAA